MNPCKITGCRRRVRGRAPGGVGYLSAAAATSGDAQRWRLSFTLVVQDCCFVLLMLGQPILRAINLRRIRRRCRIVGVVVRRQLWRRLLSRQRCCGGKAGCRRRRSRSRQKLLRRRLPCGLDRCGGRCWGVEHQEAIRRGAGRRRRRRRIRGGRRF